MYCENATQSVDVQIIVSILIIQIVIDSIAALARKEGFNERDKELFFITQVCSTELKHWCIMYFLQDILPLTTSMQASQLKKLAELCNCVVLATNQVLFLDNQYYK